MGTHVNQHLKRTGLFLVRVWTEGDDDEEQSGSGDVEWHGRVQRVVDGEAHEFDNLQDLMELLRKMLSAAQGEGKQ